MFVPFRQGIVSVQNSPSFIAATGSTVSLNISTTALIISFAYQNTNYLFSENVSISNAWVGPFGATTRWLYWNLDLKTGVRTFGATKFNPLYGDVYPTFPAVDQHFFSLKDMMLKVWDGLNWNAKLRVFAGEITGGVLTVNAVGTQIQLNQGGNQGFLLFDETSSPIVNLRGQFITTATTLYAQNNPFNIYKVDSMQVDGKATQSIPAYSAVTWVGMNKLGLASYTDYKHPAVGIAVESITKDQIKKFVTTGYVTNSGWNFTAATNTPVWVGLNGEITTTVPTTWSMQQIGTVVGPTTIHVKIEKIVLLGNQIAIATPTPTPTLSSTITVTPSTTRTVTPTVTPTVTISITASLTPTCSLTPTASLTPSVTATLTVTPSITPSVTPTNSITPTMTQTLTPSVTITITPTITPVPSITPTVTPTASPIVAGAITADSISVLVDSTTITVDEL